MLIGLILALQELSDKDALPKGIGDWLRLVLGLMRGLGVR